MCSLSMLMASCLCLAVTVHAQGSGGFGTAGGSLSPSVMYDYAYGEVGQGAARVSSLRAVILWRGRPTWNGELSTDTTAQRIAHRTYRARVDSAENAQGMFVGGQRGLITYGGELDRDRNSFHLLGKTYEIPLRDSAIVLMVDRVDSPGGPPFVAGVAYIDAHLPDAFWTKSWSSGDTTFIVHAGSGSHALETALQRIPAVRDFLR